MTHARRQPVRAFTLVELMVVVAIIVTLLAILMPSLNGAIDRAETAACQSNQRQLAIGYLAYTNDHFGALMQGVPADTKDAFVYTGAGPDPIRNGALFKYVPNLELFRCPADPNGNDRSYVIPGVLRGEGWTGGTQMGTDRLTGVLNPSKQLLFLEESDHRGWNIGSWLIRADDGGEFHWVDYVGLFHENQTADDFVFLDGHVVRRKWQDQTTIDTGRAQTFYLYDPNNPDWSWIRPYYRQMETRGSCRFIGG